MQHYLQLISFLKNLTMAPLSRSQSSPKPTTIRHFTDPNHPLHLVNIADEFLCNGCTALGFGTRYRCHACDVDLHEFCATCPPTAPSPLHPAHPLALVNHPVNDRFCDLCGDLVCGLFYTCRACDFDVHPLCTQLPLHARLMVHPHHLLALQPGGPTGCAMCFKGCTSWRYRCGVCCLDVHLECVIADVAQKCAVGVPVGGGGGMNHDHATAAKGGGQTSGGGRKSKRIYSVLGRLAISAVTTSLIGIPLGM